MLGIQEHRPFVMKQMSVDGWLMVDDNHLHHLLHHHKNIDDGVVSTSITSPGPPDITY